MSRNRSSSGSRRSGSPNEVRTSLVFQRVPPSGTVLSRQSSRASFHLLLPTYLPPSFVQGKGLVPRPAGSSNNQHTHNKRMQAKLRQRHSPLVSETRRPHAPLPPVPFPVTPSAGEPGPTLLDNVAESDFVEWHEAKAPLEYARSTQSAFDSADALSSPLNRPLLPHHSHSYMVAVEKSDMLPCLRASGADDALVQGLMLAIKVHVWAEIKACATFGSFLLVVPLSAPLFFPLIFYSPPSPPHPHSRTTACAWKVLALPSAPRRRRWPAAAVQHRPRGAATAPTPTRLQPAPFARPKRRTFACGSRVMYVFIFCYGAPCASNWARIPGTTGLTPSPACVLLHRRANG